MSSLFPHANIVAGVFVIVVGFCFHWIGQLVSVLNWPFAEKIGLQEKGMLPEYKVYEHAIAIADISVGWLYGVAGIGLVVGAEWAYKLAWIPGAILIYHAISAWVWERNRRATGHGLWSNTMRIIWCSSNALAGMLAILVAWVGRTG
jgi:hypothetical protein